MPDVNFINIPVRLYRSKNQNVILLFWNLRSLTANLPILFIVFFYNASTEYMNGNLG